MIKITEKYEPMTFDEALLLPEYAHCQELIHYLENTPNKDILPRKYEMSIEGIASRKLSVLFNENPTKTLKSVIATVVEALPNDLPPKLLLKMTKFIIIEWGKLSSKSLQKNNEMQLV
jgi:hypothetical protein